MNVGMDALVKRLDFLYRKLEEIEFADIDEFLAEAEEKAKAEGYDIKVGRFPLLANGKALAMGEGEGLIKTIFCSKTGALLGAHLIGAEVTEMIQGYAIARTLETTEAELMRTVFPHPTISEAMHESVLDAFDRAIHF